MATFIPQTDLVQFQPYPDEQWAAALDAAAPTFAQKLVDTTGEGGEENWWDAAARLMTAVVMSDQQRKLLQVQVDRAKQGLPPLDMSQYSAGVSVGVAPETQRLLTWGLVGIGALLALTMLKGNRR